MKILLINSNGEYRRIESNKGAEAVIISTCKILRCFFTNVEFITTIQISEDLSKRLDCKVIKNKLFSLKTYSLFTSFKSTIDLMRCIIWKFLKNHLRTNLNFLVNNSKLKEFSTSDLIIHLGMDLYSDDFGMRVIIEHSKDILMALILGKPIVMWAESIGPFRTRLSRFVARYILNEVSLITLRENVSKKHLDQLGVVRTPTYLTADPAFLLDPVPDQKIKEIFQTYGLIDKTEYLLGVSLAYLGGEAKRAKSMSILGVLSKTIAYIFPEKICRLILEKGKKTEVYSTKKQKYINLMASIIDWIVEELGANVVLIPHEEPLIGREIHEEVFGQVKRKDKVILLPYNLKTQEIKGIIGQCKAFVGGKMHANIASLSQCVPTVGLAYSYKFWGIMALFKQESYVSKSIDFEDVIEKLKDVWTHRDIITIDLRNKQDKIKNLATLNGKIVKDFWKAM